MCLRSSKRSSPSHLHQLDPFKQKRTNKKKRKHTQKRNVGGKKKKLKNRKKTESPLRITFFYPICFFSSCFWFCFHLKKRIKCDGEMHGQTHTRTHTNTHPFYFRRGLLIPKLHALGMHKCVYRLGNWFSSSSSPLCCFLYSYYFLLFFLFFSTFFLLSKLNEMIYY